MKRVCFGLREYSMLNAVQLLAPNLPCSKSFCRETPLSFLARLLSPPVESNNLDVELLRYENHYTICFNPKLQPQAIPAPCGTFALVCSCRKIGFVYPC